MPQDIRTKAFVLRRTNYGESDRILSLLTEDGYISAIAKGVRKIKSKLSGGIELFCLNEITVHTGKSNSLCTLTSAKMLEHYDQIPISLEKLELASKVIKYIARAAEASDGSVYFPFMKDILSEINSGSDLGMIEVWFWFNFARISGESVNILRDTDGAPLASDMTYVWDPKESALRPRMGGNIGEKEIKLLRFILSSSLSDSLRVMGTKNLIPSLLIIGKSINHAN